MMIYSRCHITVAVPKIGEIDAASSLIL